MPRREIDPAQLTEDYFGNNIAVTCPLCSKVFVVSSFFPPKSDGTRMCPQCGKSKATVKGGAKSGGTAYIEWQDKS